MMDARPDAAAPARGARAYYNYQFQSGVYDPAQAGSDEQYRSGI